MATSATTVMATAAAAVAEETTALAILVAVIIQAPVHAMMDRTSKKMESSTGSTTVQAFLIQTKKILMVTVLAMHAKAQCQLTVTSTPIKAALLMHGTTALKFQILI